jgi:TPR repeat protein
MANLGNMLMGGRGLAKDEAEAVRWLRKAADAGDTNGMASLGFAYETGRGIAKNESEAIRWYRKAADAGHTWATKRLQERGR